MSVPGFQMYIEDQSPIHRLDPRVKLLMLIGFFFISAFSVWTLLLPGALILFSFILAIIAGKKTLINLVKQLYWSLGIIGFSTCILFIFISAWNKTVIGVVPFLNLPYYYEGLYWGVFTTYRIYALFAYAIVFFSTTKPEHLVRSLVKLGMPYEIGHMILTAINIFPVLISEFRRVIIAQQSRAMVVKGLFERIKQMAAIIIPVTGSAMNRAEMQSWVLEARGFTSVGKKTSLYEFSPDKIDYLFGFAAIGLMALNSYLLIRFGYLVDPLGWNTRLIPILLLFFELNFIAFTILALTPVFKKFLYLLGLRVKKGDRY